MRWNNWNNSFNLIIEKGTTEQFEKTRLCYVEGGICLISMQAELLLFYIGKRENIRQDQVCNFLTDLTVRLAVCDFL